MVWVSWGEHVLASASDAHSQGTHTRTHACTHARTHTHTRVHARTHTHTHHHHYHVHAVQVHFPQERDMRFPSEKERQDKSRGVRLTNLEKCLLTKMFYTTGLTFTKLADLWGCCEHTVARAIEYWDPRWKQVCHAILIYHTLTLTTTTYRYH